MRAKKTIIRPFHERPRIEQFFSTAEMKAVAIEDAVEKLFDKEGLAQVRIESYAIMKKWREELEEDKRLHPEFYPDENDYDGNYYGSTT